MRSCLMRTNSEMLRFRVDASPYLASNSFALRKMSARPFFRCGSFFFSSRRRHTRCGRDWSSDVCSSDLPELRRASARGMVETGFHGYAIGGLAVGEPQAVMLAMIEEVVPILPVDRPRYLMGVGTPQDMLEAVAREIGRASCRERV